MTCSIDNLTLLSNLTNKHQFHRFMTSTDNEYVKSYKSNPDVYPYRDSWLMVDGSFLQYAEGPASRVPEIRFEFNPNKCNIADVLTLRTFFEKPRPSRVDVAIDFEQDLSRYLWICSGMKSNRWYSRHGRLETLYYGASSSALQYRIYDKAVEQKAKGRTWWRVEAQSRYRPGDKDHLPADLFKNLYAIAPEQEMVEDTALVQFLRDYPERMPDLTRYRRLKLQALADTTIVNVKRLYQESRADLRKALNLWVEN